MEIVEAEAGEILAAVPLLGGVLMLMPAVLLTFPIIAMVSALNHQGQDALNQTSANNRFPEIPS